MSLFAAKLLSEIFNKEYLFWWNLTNIFLFTPSVGVEHFWIDLGESHVFVPTHSVGVVHIFGGVYVVLILKA